MEGGDIVKNPLRKIFANLKLKNEEDNKPTKFGYLLILALIGLLLIVIGGLFQPSSDDKNMSLSTDSLTLDQKEKETFGQKKETKSEKVINLEKGYEEDLVYLLDKIQGVSEVEVMVNLNATKQKVYEKNLVIGQQTSEETDQNGGERIVEDSTKESEVVLVRQGDQEVPLLVQTKKPEVRGVLIVAKGVDHMQLKQWVVQAVSRVLDVPTHRVSVMPKN